MSLEDLLARTDARRAADAARFAHLDPDECQLCLARGPDMRSLFLRCMYAVHEVVPEMIDLWAVPDMQHVKEFYYLRTCKYCRGNLLVALQAWRGVALARRSLPKDSDGCPVEQEAQANIPVRIHGAVHMLTEEEWLEQEKRKARE